LDAAGKDYVLIETVGVGQAEVEISRLAQATVVVMVPGMGDDVQAIKAGIMEIADIFVINKADLPGADQLERDLRAEAGKPILRTVGTEGKGVEELVEWLNRFLTTSTQDHVQRLEKPHYHGTVIDHLGIAVRSLGDAAAFYEALGLRASHRETVAAEKVHVAMFPAGESRIELLEAAGPDSPISNFLEKRGPGLHHVALRVSDLPATVERLRAAGARLLNEPRRGAGGHLYVFVHPADAGGVLLELIQESGN
jgi:GTPase